MSIARGSLSGGPAASTDFAPVAGLTRTTWLVARHVQRPVLLDGDVTRVVERRARRDGRDRARPGIDAAQRDPVRDEQLPGRVHGEAGGVARDRRRGTARRVARSSRSTSSRWRSETYALPPGASAMPTGSCRPSPLTTVSTVPERAIENTASAPSSATSSAPSAATATAHGSLSGAPPASSEAAPAGGHAAARGRSCRTSCPRRRSRCRPERRAPPQAQPRGTRARASAGASTPHAGTASEPISAANASTTRGSKCSPAQRSISATASLTVRPGW